MIDAVLEMETGEILTAYWTRVWFELFRVPTS